MKINLRLVSLMLVSFAISGFYTGIASAQTATPATIVNEQIIEQRPTCTGPAARAVMLGDSWAQYMWDDGSHNDIFNKFGQADKDMLSSSEGAMPAAGYTGPGYSISGSEARDWINPDFSQFTTNVINAIAANPNVEVVVVSIGGNDVLAAESGGGWFATMGAVAEQALFDTIEANTFTIINNIDAAFPTRNLKYMISSYDYVNFNTGFLFCPFYACPKREDLSGSGPLLTDAQLNDMMVTVEWQRTGWAADPRVVYDNGVGLMHYYYGNTAQGPGVTPYPVSFAPFAPWPPGNPQYPSLRANFRSGPDPIHLNYDGYQYKITNQTMNHFFPMFRGTPDLTFFSAGGTQDGWTDGTATGTNGMNVGDTAGNNRSYGILSFDTSAIPAGATVDSASFYLIRESAAGTNPFGGTGTLGLPVIDVIAGNFGASVNVEAADALAAADVTDAGCAYGTAGQNYYAVRVDLTPAGLAAVNTTGTTQFRISFPNSDGDAGNDWVIFKDGDSPMLVGDERIVTTWETFEKVMPDGTMIQEQEKIMAIVHQGLAEYNNSPAPFLDVNYTVTCAPSPPPTLAGPTDGAIDVSTDPTLNWASEPTATSYEIEIATDAGFVSIVETATGIAGTTYSPATLLNDTDYYWRVRSENACGAGVYPAEFTFHTEALLLSCTTYNSADIPQPIPTTGAAVSTINIPTGGTIFDLNVLNLTGIHGRMGQINFNLQSPAASTTMILDTGACGNTDNFDINLDDDVAPGAFPCPPIDGLTYQPTNPLSLFDGEDSTGTWTLTINDIAGGGGADGSGQLNSWAIEVCIPAPACGPAPMDVADTTAAAAGANVNINWTDTDGANYEIHDSPMPYYTPITTTLLTTIAPGTGTHPDPVLGVSTAVNHYYYVVPINGCGTPSVGPYIHVGEFDFAIIPGA